MRDGDSQDAQTAQIIGLVPWERTLHRARRLDKALAALTGTARSGGLDSLEEARRELQKATPLEAYYALKSLGLDGSVGALDALTPEQSQTLMDIEGWRADVLEIPDVLSWLQAFRVAGHAALVKAARGLDVEGLATLFRRRLFIAHVPKEDRSDDEPLPEWLRNPSEAIEPIVQTPDGRFYVAARVIDERDELEEDGTLIEEEEREHVLGLLRELYLDEDWGWVAGVLRASLDDLGSALEEDAFRFRNGRMEDLGFPTRAEAMALFAPLDPAALGEAAPTYGALEHVRLPQLHTEAWSGGDLERALRALPADRLERVEADLAALANQVLVAEGVDPGDLDGVREALERARAYIELGLGHGGGDGAERLGALHPNVPFRVGFGLTVALGHRARKLAEHPGWGGLGFAALSSPERLALEALLGRRPRLDRSLEPRLAGGRLDPAASGELRAFAHAAEVEAVHGWLSELEALARGAEALRVFAPVPDEVLPEAEEERDLDTRLATLAAWGLLGRTASLEALDGEALLDLVDQAGMGAGRFERAEAVAEALTARLGGPEAAAVKARVQAGLERLAGELFSLVGQTQLDPRFVEGVLRTQSRARA